MKMKCGMNRACGELDRCLDEWLELTRTPCCEISKPFNDGKDLKYQQITAMKFII